MNKPTDIPHCVYVLRLWRTESCDLSWRASLENPRTGERTVQRRKNSLVAMRKFEIERIVRICGGGADTGPVLTRVAVARIGGGLDE